MPRMNTQTKLVFALEHIAHLYDLIEDNERQEYLTEPLSKLEFEIESQLLISYEILKVKYISISLSI